MSNIKQIVFVISVVLISFFIGRYTTPKVEEIKITDDDKKGYIEKEVVIKEISHLPDFIKNELAKFGIEEPLDENKWSKFIDLLKVQNINELNQLTNNSLLSHAVRFDDIEYLKYLIKNGYDINQTNSNGNTILMEAFKYSSLETIKELLNLNANLNAVNQNGKDMLHFALQDDDYYHSKVKFLLKNGFSLENATPYFSELNKVHNKDLLLKYAKNIDFSEPVTKNSKDKNYFESVLIDLKDEYVANQLLETADIKIEDGFNALHTVVIAKEYSNAFLEKLIEKGFDVNSKTQTVGQTPLMYAINGRELDKIETLLKNGADVTIFDNTGKNAFDYVNQSKIITNQEQKNKIIELLNKYNKN